MTFCGYSDNFDGLLGPLWCNRKKLRFKPRILGPVFVKNM